MEVLVVDGRSRALKTFVASVTKASRINPELLVLRFALDLGFFTDLLLTERSDYRHGISVTIRDLPIPMPVILMGEYSARGSAGHVSVVYSDGYGPQPHRRITIVGGLGSPFGGGGLHPLANPIPGVWINGPVSVEEVRTFRNSNPNTTDAAWSGIRLAAQADKRSVLLVEGQSDVVRTWKFRSDASESVEVPDEHRAEIFSAQVIVGKILRGQARWNRSWENRETPITDEEVRTEILRLIEAFHSTPTPKLGDPRREEVLGRAFQNWQVGNLATNEVVAKVKNDILENQS